MQSVDDCNHPGLVLLSLGWQGSDPGSGAGTFNKLNGVIEVRFGRGY
jgi:hypothetical protein